MDASRVAGREACRAIKRLVLSDLLSCGQFEGPAGLQERLDAGPTNWK